VLPPLRSLCSLCLACAFLCRAQVVSPSPASPPKVLLLVRQQFKAGRSHARERLERATAALYNRLEVPVYWMELAAFTGTSEAMFLDPFDSFEAVEKASAVLGQLYEAHPESARLQAGIDDLVASQTSILAVRLDPANAGINLAKARFLRMLVVRTSLGDQPPSADDLMPSIVYQVTSGMVGPTFFIFQPLTEFAEISPAHLTNGSVVEDSVYAVEPEMSHVSRAFAEQEPEFWMKP
jgi:hypothetical protein